MPVATVGVAVLLGAVAVTTAAPLPEAASPAVRSCYDTHGPGLHDIQLPSGRHFLLALPDLLPGGTRVPAVIDWHGFSESPFYQNKLVGLEETLARYKWIGGEPRCCCCCCCCCCGPHACQQPTCQDPARLGAAATPNRACVPCLRHAPPCAQRFPSAPHRARRTTAARHKAATSSTAQTLAPSTREHAAATPRARARRTSSSRSR